ncbi:hypothetical protein RHMOL_Rhmol04G0199800 [Rhododendron molle]|uniref:Uncharacterized protein n=1 Tax=Rhododendron molle TaxID=49168 RepID=A0ACC0P3I9_RHOML|nr:hypothetical protein RHMOL_Rhmol04G0199800 [Rhododendron molle]
MADHGGNGGGGEVVNQIEDQGGLMEREIGDQTAARTVEDVGAEARDGGDGEQEQQETAGGVEEHRAIKGVPRATDQAGAEGSRKEHAEEVRIEEVQTTEAAPVEIREEDIAFRPPAGAATSSRHVPITYADIAEHAPDELLAKLLEDHPVIGEYVLKAKEDQARAIEEAEAVARAERERAGSERLAADIEAEEREAEEAQGVRVSVVAEAGAMKRPEFFRGDLYAPETALVCTVRLCGIQATTAD